MSRDSAQKRKEPPVMGISRDIERKRKKLLHMEMSRDNGKKDAYVKNELQLQLL